MILINALDVPQPHDDVITVFVEVHNQGLRFGLSAQCDVLMALLLANPIPRQQLNAALFSALSPLVSSFGPWRSGLGFRQDSVQVLVHVSLSGEDIQFSPVQMVISPVQVSLSAPSAPLLLTMEQSEPMITDTVEIHSMGEIPQPAQFVADAPEPLMPPLSLPEEGSSR